MSESVFHFKRFTIHQNRTAMKVGTDGVLLGAWIKPDDANYILDIGTGTGLIALMIAQKSTGFIDAIEIDESSYLQALDNCNGSEWKNRIRVIHSSLQEFKPGKRYDLIFSNPPYFIDSYTTPNEARNRARSASASLSYEELVEGVVRLLNTNGKFCIILPSKESTFFRNLAEQNGVFCNKITRVKTKNSKPEKRIMMEFSRNESILFEDELVIQEEMDERIFTDQYKSLTRDYYISF